MRRAHPKWGRACLFIQLSNHFSSTFPGAPRRSAKQLPLRTQAWERLAGAFRGWKGGVDYLRDPKPANLTEPQDHNIAVEIPGKTSTILAIGQSTGFLTGDN